MHRFDPRTYQQEVVDAFRSGEYDRYYLVWHRRAGKDRTLWNLMIEAALERVGIYYYMLPELAQARRVIWEGMDSDTGLNFLDNVPEGALDEVRKQSMQVKLSNGSLIQLLGSDNYNSLIGANPVAMVFSEYSVCNPEAEGYFKPMIAHNKGWIAYIYTPRGQNHAWEAWQRAQKLDNCFTSLKTIDDTFKDEAQTIPAFSQEDYQKEIAEGMPLNKAKQEYYCSFHAAAEGAFFTDELNSMRAENRVTRLAIEPWLPTWACWDIGVRDDTAIWFVQLAGKEIRLVGFMSDHNRSAQHYAEEVKKWQIENKVGEIVNKWPHDIVQIEFGSGEMRISTLRKYGLQGDVVKRTKSKTDSINAARAIMPYCLIDPVRCENGLHALSSYCRTYDPKLRSYSERPERNFATHGADAFQTMAASINIKDYRPSTDIFKRKPVAPLSVLNRRGRGTTWASR